MVLNRQSAVRVQLKDLNRFITRVQRKLRLPAGAVTVCLVTNRQMSRWNSAFRGKKGATDVLSFGTEGGRGGKGSKGSERGRGKASHGNGFSPTPFTSLNSSTSYLGDIAIAPSVARANARRFGRTLDEELRILILHGLLHLMGYDHETDQGEMDRFEQRLRRALGLA